MNAAGGPRVPFTKIDAAKGETDHLWPLALADGKTVVFVIYYGALSTSKLAMTSIADGKITPLGINGIRPLALLDGNLVYVQADGTIMAVPLDVRGRRVTGTALPVLDPVVVPSSGGNGNSAIFVSRSGALVQSRGTSTSQLAWIGRDGASHVFVSELRGYSHPRLSPDGRRVTVSISDSQSSDIFVYDLATSTLTRLTSTNSAFAPSWSPDGKYVFYLANIANAKPAVFRQLADGGSPAERLAATEGIASDFALSPDGKSILVTSFTDSWDILLTRLDSGAKSRPYLNTKASEVAATFSPDGRWVAVTSDESGAAEVFVRSFPDPSTRVQVSA
ncbi:MAG: TolB family protein, partial [Polyangiaceae bacterium]